MKREHWWPVGLVAGLVLVVAANVGLAIVAARGDGAAVEPDYYRRALAWDSTRAVDARSDALGWHVRAAVAAPADPVSGAVMDVRVTDAAGAPVVGATAGVRGYALARSATTRLDVVLGDAGGGAYRATLPVQRVEWHALSLTIDRGGEHYTATLRCLPGEVCRPS